MLKVTLTRKSRKGNAVRGTMLLPFSQRPYMEDNEDVTIATLENADFLIPAGLYTLEQTYSPKFKRLMPLVSGVPDRDGIRIHRGTKPEHSEGCVLVDMAGQTYIDVLFNRLKNYYDNENLQIEIVEDFAD